jgi:hypothetical protein
MRATLVNPQQAHQEFTAAWHEAKAMLISGRRMVLELKAESRSLKQNARLWAMLTDIAQQVDWYGRKLTQEEWKHVFTAALTKQDVVPGIDGGFVVLGKSTSKMTRAEMVDLQTLMEAFGSDKGVKWSPTSQGRLTHD